MLLIDGVKYESWTPTNEDEFEREVKEHTQDIFGEQSTYFDRKQKLKSLSGIGSIPDGYVIILGESPHWHIVEVELSSHPLHEHIVSQVSRFITGISNLSTQREIARAIHEEITRDVFLKLKVEQAIGSTEIYKFLSELIAEQPILTIIIEEDTQGLREAIRTLAHSQIKIVEFQTFTREGIGLPVHAHLFEPLYRPVVLTEPKPSLSLDDIIAFEIKCQPSYIKYSYIGIKKRYRHLFPDFGTMIELTTDDGDVFEAEVGNSSGSMELWYLRDWYQKNPDLKEGDKIMITPVEEKKKYYLQIIKSEKETV